MSRIEDTYVRCAEMLDDESTPSKMTIPEAIEFWEGIIAEAQGRLDALAEDIKEQEPDDE